MNCADLDRFLEAHIEGRLGRARAAVLRRHLAQCRHCAARIHWLRAFERELALRVPALSHHGRVWAGLEIEAVASAARPAAGSMLPPPSHLLRLPPPAKRPPQGEARPAARPRRRQRPALLLRRVLSRLLGLAVLAAALAGIIQLGAGWLVGDRSRTQPVHSGFAVPQGDMAPVASSGDFEVLGEVAPNGARDVPVPE